MLSLYFVVCGLVFSGTHYQINQAIAHTRLQRLAEQARRVAQDPIVQIQIPDEDIITHPQSGNSSRPEVAAISKQHNRLVRSASLNAIEDRLSREEQIARWREKMKKL